MDMFRHVFGYYIYIINYKLDIYIYIYLLEGRLCVTHKMKNRGTGKTNLFGVWLVNGK